jgi:quinol monooxygenase YgiN
MVTVLIRCRVADYDFWRPRYDAAIRRDMGLGVLSSQVWRSQDDRNVVVILETYDSRESVEALMSSPEIQAEMVADGVDPASVQLDILDAAPPTS